MTLPEVTPENEHFWQGGAEGELRLLRCTSCTMWVHPPLPSCPRCGGVLEVRAASGAATVHAVTVNHQRWRSDTDEPYAVAVVRLDEQDDLLLVTNVPVGTTIDDRVHVRFDSEGDVWLPRFVP